MTKKRRLAAVILAVLVLVALMTSSILMASEADHDCIGDGCPVCAVIALCRNTLRALCDALLLAAVVSACVRAAAILVAGLRASSYRETPITLKVKLLN